MQASVDMLFDEGGSGNQMEQGDFVGGGQGADIQPVSAAADTVVEDVALVQPKRQRKRKTMVVDAGEPSHSPKRLRKDHETPSGTSVGGKSISAVQRLLAIAVLNAEVRVTATFTLPFVTSSVSTTPEHEGGDHTDSLVGLNLCTIGASQRFVISLDSSHHSGANVAEAEVDSLVRSSMPIMMTITTVTPTVDPVSTVKEKFVKPSPIVACFSSAGGTDPAMGGFSDFTSSDFLVGGIRTVIDPDTNLAANQMSLSAEVRMCAEYNVKERRMLKSVVEKQVEMLKVRDVEIESLKVQLALKEAEAAKAIRLKEA
ncbi:hypothetical protein Tco_1040792 [Tanacetum coccineum]|uniref:Uncharacterized protein n=1 Tax=Tanacetum coccineum TaxID=301880 RepID=A0ABQ5GGH9_9ASTR